MAYVDFREVGSGGGPQPLPVQCRVEAQASGADRLMPLEWAVVAIARKDGVASLRRPGRLSTALRALFRQRNPKLADERLEALRRMAVLTWQNGYTVPSHELRDFLAAGFTSGQYETMVDSIRAAQARPQSRAHASRAWPNAGPLEPFPTLTGS